LFFAAEGRGFGRASPSTHFSVPARARRWRVSLPLFTNAPRPPHVPWASPACGPCWSRWAAASTWRPCPTSCWPLVRRRGAPACTCRTTLLRPLLLHHPPARQAGVLTVGQWGGQGRRRGVLLTLELPRNNTKCMASFSNVRPALSLPIPPDASIWVHQFVKAMRDERGEPLPNAHLIGFFRRICK